MITDKQCVLDIHFMMGVFFFVGCRRDSFITHRAFCDALAEESARAITGNPVLLSSQAAVAGPSSSTPHSHSQISLQQQQQQQHQQQQQFNNSNNDFHAFQMKKEQQSFSIRPPHEMVPPWMSSSLPSSSMFPTRLDHDFTQQPTQDLGLHEIQNPSPSSLGPTLPPYHPTISPHMSATALLQKAAQMGATMSKTTTAGGSGSPPAMNMNMNMNMNMIRPHQAHMSTDHSGGNITTGFGLNLSSHGEMGGGFVQTPFGNKAAAAGGGGGGAPSHSLLLQDMMTSLSSAAGFDSSSFEDAFGGMLNSRKNGNNLHQTFLSKSATTTSTATHHTAAAAGGGGGNDGLTRDFLGLRALSHSDILNIAGLGTCMNTTTPHDHPNQTQQKPWQG